MKSIDTLIKNSEIKIDFPSKSPETDNYSRCGTLAYNTTGVAGLNRDDVLAGIRSESVRDARVGLVEFDANHGFIDGNHGGIYRDDNTGPDYGSLTSLNCEGLGSPAFERAIIEWNRKNGFPDCPGEERRRQEEIDQPDDQPVKEPKVPFWKRIGFSEEYRH